MKKFDLGNGHTLEIEKANRGFDDEYRVTYKEDGVALFPTEYYNKDAIEFEFGITF